MDQTTYIKNHVIALTGGIATGKSTVASLLREKGWMVFDADQMAREIAQPGEPAYQKMVAAFGPRVLNPDQSINRAWLRQRLIEDPSTKPLLESITHPAIQERFALKLKDANFPQKTIFYEASLIVEAGRHRDFAELWVCHVPREIQIDRLRARDGLTIQQAEAMLSRQMPNDAKVSLADVVIDTNCPRDTIAIPWHRLRQEKT